MINQPYEISNEFNITELLGHFDSNYIFDIITDKLDNIDYSSVLKEPNIVISFEENFKIMNDRFPGDSQNIRMLRAQVYTDIINILCEKFNLQFNEDDDNIDRYTLAYQLYDFLVCNRNTYLINFFTSFIINNKGSLCGFLNLDEYRKSKETSAAYGKRIYDDPMYGAISANMAKVIRHISTIDISLMNIFQSTYTNPEILIFLDNAIADRGDFFRDFYCSIFDQPEIMPIIITNIRLSLQKIVGNISMQEIMSYGGNA